MIASGNESRILISIESGSENGNGSGNERANVVGEVIFVNLDDEDWVIEIELRRRRRRGKIRKRTSRNRMKLLRFVFFVPSVAPRNQLPHQDARKERTNDDRRSSFEMLSHILRHRTQPNTRKEINREPRILGIIDREHISEIHLEISFLESFRQFL